MKQGLHTYNLLPTPLMYIHTIYHLMLSLMTTVSTAAVRVHCLPNELVLYSMTVWSGNEASYPQSDNQLIWQPK